MLWNSSLPWSTPPPFYDHISFALLMFLCCFWCSLCFFGFEALLFFVCFRFVLLLCVFIVWCVFVLACDVVCLLVLLKLLRFPLYISVFRFQFVLAVFSVVSNMHGELVPWNEVFWWNTCFLCRVVFCFAVFRVIQFLPCSGILMVCFSGCLCVCVCVSAWWRIVLLCHLATHQYASVV